MVPAEEPLVQPKAKDALHHGPILVRLEGIVKRFGSQVVLDGVDLEISAGQVVSIIGQSGGGKTTLLRCMNLLETPDAGTLQIEDRVICAGGRVSAAEDLVKLRQKVGMVFQQFHLFPHLTAVENITLPLTRVAGMSVADAIDQALRLLGEVGMRSKALALPATMSGGEQQRVAIARALALRPLVLLFDEPTSALDPESTADVNSVMRTLARSGVTMVVATHELAFAEDASDRVVFVDCGRILESGPPDLMLHHPHEGRTKEFVASFSGRGSAGHRGGAS